MEKNHSYINYFIAAVWLVNGLLCKVLNLVPRHEQIVGEILGNEHARLFTCLIGISEILMACWILSKFKSSWNAITQIIVIAIMNILEFVLAPELLLWGKMNIVFAFCFIGFIYYNEFVIQKKLNSQKS